MMGGLYRVQADESACWGQHWCGPRPGEFLPHGQEVLVARIEPTCEDGRSAEVYCAAHPARFYTVCSGELIIRTGSGAAELAHAIAKTLAEGMMGVETRL